MKNTMFILAIAAIAILGESNAFANVHHKHNENTLDLTNEVTRTLRLINPILQNGASTIQRVHLQNHSDDLVVSAYDKTGSDTVLGENQHNLRVTQYSLGLRSHQRTTEHLLNLESGILTHSENRWNDNWNDSRVSVSRKELAEATIRYG